MAAAWVRLGPLPPGLLDERDRPSTVVVDRAGVPLYEARAGDGTRGRRIAADALPPLVVAATLAAEDRRFWSHPGVDPIAVARALTRNLRERRTAEGGSTITQQVVKLLRNRDDPRRPRGLREKAREAVLALRLEHRLSKAEILALYLNLASYGNQIAGAERASRAYFGVSAGMLTPAQAAFLAALPQRPSGFNPYRDPAAAAPRQHAILAQMRASGAITPAQFDDARGERLALGREGAPFTAPHFVEMVLAAAGAARPPRIETTLDAGLQAEVQGIIASHRPMLRRHGAANVAVAVLHNATGEWLAWEGSGDYFDTTSGGTINGVTAARQPGSALKPFTYALAFEEGFTPASVLADLPSSFPTADPGVVYRPRNYDGLYRGPMLARRALAGSENVPAVALAAELGVPKVLRFLQRAGLTTFDRTASHYGLGVTLGNAEVRLDELVAAYAALARGGEWIQPAFLRGSAVRERRRLVAPRTAFWITDILADAEAREYVFGRGGSLELPFPAAVKTGTSQAYHDNWTVGYTRAVTVGVWVGNFDRTPLRNSSGVTGAAPIFHAVMLAAQARAAGSGGDIVARPPDAVRREICGLSGQLAHAWCPTKHHEWLDGAAAPLPCSWHHFGDEGLLTIYPPQYRAWAERHDPASRAAAPARSEMRAARAGAAPGAASLTIASPADGATYLIDPTLRREFQTLALRAVAERPVRVRWTIGGREIATASSQNAVEWTLTPGRHTIAARDDHGRGAEVTIVVR